MREMAQNVDGLRRILTNVKTRGTFGEVQLAMILSDLLTPEQYETNVATRPGSRDRVGICRQAAGRKSGSHVLLPIDAKFPTEDYERLIELPTKQIRKKRRLRAKRFRREFSRKRRKFAINTSKCLLLRSLP
mgnify:CR=1 FL=1